MYFPLFNFSSLFLLYNIYKYNFRNLRMSLGATFYQLVARRFSTVLVAVTAGAYIMNYTLNGVTDAYWDAVSYFLFIYLFLLLKSHAYIPYS